MHAMTDDECTALKWLLEGWGNERNGIVYITPEGRQLVGYESSMAPGRAALIRVLKASAPLNAAIQKALAKAGVPSDMARGAIAFLEPISVSKVWITAEVKRRCRGRPRKDIDNAGGVFEMKLTLTRREGCGRPRKDVDGVVEGMIATNSTDGARNQKSLPGQLHVSRATFYRRLKKGRLIRSKKLRKPLVPKNK
jgi:hypothetical protein